MSEMPLLPQQLGDNLYKTTDEYNRRRFERIDEVLHRTHQATIPTLLAGYDYWDRRDRDNIAPPADTPSSINDRKFERIMTAEFADDHEHPFAPDAFQTLMSAEFTEEQQNGFSEDPFETLMNQTFPARERGQFSTQA